MVEMGKNPYAMTARALSLLVCVGVISFGLVLTQQMIFKSIVRLRPNSSSSNDQHRQLKSTSEFDDPRTVIVKKGGEVPSTSSLFIVPETHIDESKKVRPAIVQIRPPGFDHQGLVVDVLVVGSRTRSEYMTAQAKTWASHPHVRNFWGINEEQDYDPQCDQMNKGALQSYIQLCRDDMGWENTNLEIFRRKNFGLKGRTIRDNAGWFCAQRRPGHGLGWLMEMYRDSANIPDILIITDDDTSVNLENLKRSMQQHSDFVEGRPFVGAGCAYDKSLGFVFPYGGYGYFFNRAAIHQLTYPINCDDESLQHGDNFVNKLSCANLKQNTIGELDVFQNGDSALDIFYKYSATRLFCLHSDWAVGYMISHYLHENVQQLEPRRCKTTACDMESIACHQHGPEEMESFEQALISSSTSTRE